ncbi:unnamed protein product [Ostreobium quekettii]|uniref:F-box/LRR-repeat protein 15-like leucin rich repeat domain-containing protein n=1 Tax=Ostreobium quekettii TaxID=121088 RepID=A0A8S1IRB2_9CHLO|nr:unnamed protein product [Ostreobium quekettii]
MMVHFFDLNLRHSAKFGWRLDSVAHCFTALERLTLTDPVKSDLPSLSSFSRLSHLAIEGGTFGTGDAVLLGQMTNLSCLELIRCSGIRYDLRLSSLVGLTRLQLWHCDVVLDHSIAGLAMLPALTDVSLSGSGISNVGISRLAAITGLAKVAVSPRYNLVHRAVTDNGARFLAEMTNLEVLDISDCQGISNYGVALLKGLTNLTELHLPTGVSDAGLEALGALTAVTHIALPDELSDDGFRFLSHFPKLSKVSVTLSRSVSCTTVKSIADLECLVDLSILSKSCITRDGFDALSALTVLTALNIGPVGGDWNFQSHYELTDMDSMAALTNLRTLTLWHPSRMSVDINFMAMLTGLTRLRISPIY